MVNVDICIVILFITLTKLTPNIVHSASYEDSRDLHQYLLKNYSRILIPRKNQSDLMSVNVNMFLNSVIDFNTVSGIMTFSAGFFFWWKDEIIESRWKQWGSKEVKVTQIGIHHVWFPKLFVENSASITSILQFASEIDSETSFVKYYRDGSAMFYTGMVLHTTCVTNGKYYPLDEHECGIILVPVDLSSVVLNTTTTDVTTPETYPNSEWNVRSFTKVIKVMETYTRVNFKIVLYRKPVFITTNLVFPVMIITVVNGLSFFIPIKSGERLSFGTSLLLMLIVFLTTVLEMLPPTDNCLSIFNIFICIELIYSCFITFGIVMTLHIHQHLTDDIDVPDKLVTFTNLVLRRGDRVCKKNPENNQPTSSKNTNTKLDTGNKTNSLNDDQFKNNTLEIKPNATWTDVVTAVDKVLRLITTIFSLSQLIFYDIFSVGQHS